MQENSNGILQIYPYIFPVFFAVMWCVACFVGSMVSGWFTLSQRFLKRSEPYGEFKIAGPLFCTIYMRFWVHYSGIVRLTATKDSLYASVAFLFRVGHPPLCIPWSEIEFSRTRYFWRRYVVLTLGQQERIPMRIPERMARNLGLLEGLVRGTLT